MGMLSRKKYTLRTFLLLFTIITAVEFPGLLFRSSYAGEVSEREEAWYRQFVNGIGELLYGFAWPTAHYKNLSFHGFHKVESGVEIKLKLNGTSAWDDSALWVELIILVNNGEVKDIHWGKHNAILAAPGATIETLRDALVSLNEESRRRRIPQPPSTVAQITGYRFHFSNQCRHSVRLALRYARLDGTWDAVSWWTVSGNSSTYLHFENGQYLETTRSTFWYYAVIKGQSYEWRGDNEFDVRGEKLSMRKMIDDDGDSEWFITCPGK